MSVAEAMEAGFLPSLDKDQAKMFTPLELRLYWHAQDHRLLTRDIVGYPSLLNFIWCQFGGILFLSTRRFLSCRGSTIAPYNHMNVTFLVYADNTVYQNCTHTVKSRGPDEGTILVVAVPGSAHCFCRHTSLSGSLRLFEFQCEAHASHWQNVNFCYNGVWRKILVCRAPTVYSSSCHCIISLYMHKKIENLKRSAYEYDKYAPPLCWWCLAAATGRGSESDSDGYDS